MPDTQIHQLVESIPAVIYLDEEAQHRLSDAGKRLAKGTGRFGEEQVDSDASLISVERASASQARVRVRDAVGLVAVPGYEVHVRPKIPVDHLLDLMQASQTLPRFDVGSGHLAPEDDLAVLVATWFVAALERTLEFGLASDYREEHGELRTVRGRVALTPTARLYYRGRLAIVADYEEFDLDTPLNRVLLQAARVIAQGTPLPMALRRRAVRATARMAGVGLMRPSDLRALPDRRTSHYLDAIKLAHQVLRATGRTLTSGARRSWTFLIRTPGPVEEGVRKSLAAALAPLQVVKRSIALGGSTKTVNPDIVFGAGTHVADVKYKVGADDWDRGDLYEVVAFAVAIRTQHAAIIRFRTDDIPHLPPVTIGDYTIQDVVWRALPDTSPENARAAAAQRVSDWLDATHTPADESVGTSKAA